MEEARRKRRRTTTTITTAMYGMGVYVFQCHLYFIANLISSATILDLVLALIIQHSQSKSKIGRANRLYNLSFDPHKELLA